MSPSNASSECARARIPNAASPPSLSYSMPAAGTAKVIELSHANGSKASAASLRPPSGASSDTLARPSPSIQTPQSVPSIMHVPLERSDVDHRHGGDRQREGYHHEQVGARPPAVGEAHHAREADPACELDPGPVGEAEVEP